MRNIVSALVCSVVLSTGFIAAPSAYACKEGKKCNQSKDKDCDCQKKKCEKCHDEKKAGKVEKEEAAAE